MKRILVVRNALAVSWPTYSAILMSWLELAGSWVLTLGVDWTRLPWVFAGAAIATLKSKKDASGQPIHKPLWEWIAIVFSGTIIGMAGWKDVMHFIKLSPDLSSIIAGLIGWAAGGYIVGKAIKQFENDDLTLKP